MLNTIKKAEHNEIANRTCKYIELSFNGTKEINFPRLFCLCLINLTYLFPHIYDGSTRVSLDMAQLQFCPLITNTQEQEEWLTLVEQWCANRKISKKDKKVFHFCIYSSNIFNDNIPFETLVHARRSI